MVKDINPGSGSSYPDYLTDVAGTLYFAAHNGTSGYELWKSDGTLGGTVMVKDINPGSEGSWPGCLTDFGGTLYFEADDGTSGWELWKSDGTPGGTVMVKDINPGSESSYPEYLTDVAGILYFMAYDATSGYEFWNSDGTLGGTAMVKDINPGSGDSDPNYLTNVAGTLYFAATDGTSGYELWKGESISEYAVEIDIKPWSDPNSVNRDKKGVIAVAILGSDVFDPTSLDPSMMSFDFCGATQTAHDLTDSDHCVQPYYDELLEREVTANDDLYPDLVIHFYVSDLTCLSGYDRKDVVTVELEVAYNGVTYTGSDNIRIVK